MNRVPEESSLLADVLAEADAHPFRSTLLATTLLHVRRRRRRKNAVRVALPVLVVAIGVFLAPDFRPQSEPRPKPAQEIYALVQTKALSAEAIVGTRVLDPRLLVSTTRFAAIVETTSIIRFVDDAELLASTGPRRAVLVRIGPNSQKLVFADEGKSTGSRID